MTHVGRTTTLLAAMVMTLGLMVAPAMAQPVDQDGLVNVNVSGNTIQLPISAAANVCPTVNAAILAQDLAQDGYAECDADAETQAQNRGGPGGGPVDQDGLVNVNVSGNTIQVPISVAANICPTVNVALLAQELDQYGEATCDADAESQAERRGR